MASYKLDLEPPRRNVFVTQLRDHGDDNTWVNRYPIVQESSGKLLSTGIKTLQSTLLIKQNNEAIKAQKDLENRRREFQEKMAACKAKEEKLRKRQQQIKDRINKFDIFIKETEAKRRRALEKYQMEHKLREQKTQELAVYEEELVKLKQRQIQLQKKVKKYSGYGQYLMKVLEIIPENYIKNSSDSMLLGVMMRFNTLKSTNQLLTDALASKTDEIRAEQEIIHNMEQAYNKQLLIDNSELSSLQHKLENYIQRNAQLDHILETQKEMYRNQNAILGKVKLAVFNIAEKCLKRHSQPFDSMSVDDMLKLIKDFMQEHEDICRMAAKTDSPLLVSSAIRELFAVQSGAQLLLPGKSSPGKTWNPSKSKVSQVVRWDM